MSGYRKVTKRLDLTSSMGVAPSGRVWDAPCGMPVRDLTIYLSTRNQVTGAGNLDWQVIYGGVWGGIPFDAASTHSGGIVQTDGNIGGGTEITHKIYSDRSLFSSNLRSVRPGVGGVDLGIDGLPLVVFLRSWKKFDAVSVWVTFVSWDQSELV